MRSERILGAYRVIFAATIVALSIETMMQAKGFTDHRFWLAAIEIVASALLLFRRTQRVGLPLLLATFTVAAVHDIVIGHPPFELLLLGASAATIVLLDRAIHRDLP
jgi:hypothetical protein